MTTALSIVVRPYWLSGWFLRVLAVPYVLVDGVEHRARWRRPLRLDVPPGARIVAAGIRYRGLQRLLGVRPTAVNARPGDHLRLVAQNGPLNSEPFRVRLAPRTESA